MKIGVSIAAGMALAAFAATAPVLAQGKQKADASQMVDATKPEVLLAIAKGYGSADLGKDSGGDPMITGRMNGNKYTVLFYGCKDGKDCSTVQFRAAFEVRKKPTLEEVNALNAKTRFGKVYLDKDNDPAVEMDVNLDHGVSKKNLDDTFDWWKTVLGGVKKNFTS